MVRPESHRNQGRRRGRQASYLVVAALAMAACVGQIADADPPGSEGVPPGVEVPNGGAAGPGGSGGTGGAPPPGVFVPAPGGFRLLTSVEYANTIRDLLGSKAAVPAEVLPDLRIEGFRSVGAMKVTLADQPIQDLALTAASLAQEVMADPTRREAIVGCKPAGPNDAACARTFVTGFGRRAFRRPLDAAEITRYTGLLLKGATAFGDFWGGAETALTAFLQSTIFLYRPELGVAGASAGAPRALKGYEMAGRLSYFLTATTPSPALLDAAGRGELDTTDGVRQSAGRLLDARGFEALDGLFEEWLHLDKLDSQYQLGVEIRTAMRDETLALLGDVSFGPGRSFVEAMTSKQAQVTPALAKYYGLVAPAGAPVGPRGLVSVALPRPCRASGCSGRAAFSLRRSGAASSSAPRGSTSSSCAPVRRPRGRPCPTSIRRAAR